LRAAGCVHAEDEARLLMSSAGTDAELDVMLEQRRAGLPLEYVLGFAVFCGQRIAVERGVFVPRRRTEFLVHHAARLIAPGAVVVDLCCGTGAIGVALAARVGRIVVYACDVDARAVQCARRNLLAIDGQVLEGDLYDPLPVRLRRNVQLIVTSPPYVPSGDMSLLPAEARLHEPLQALDGGDDGMAIQRRVVGGAARWLARGGHLLVECSQRQAAPLAEEFGRHGMTATAVASDDLGATVVVGTVRR
jgi:release factor glutamine methyltransferase